MAKKSVGEQILDSMQQFTNMLESPGQLYVSWDKLMSKRTWHKVNHVTDRFAVCGEALGLSVTYRKRPLKVDRCKKCEATP